MNFGTILLLASTLIPACTKSGTSGKVTSKDTLPYSPPSSSSSGGVSREYKIGVVVYRKEDTFISSVQDAINEIAAGKATIRSLDSANQQQIQNEQIDHLLSESIDVLLVNPVQRSSVGILIDKAKSANKPIIFFNREPLPEDLQRWNQIYYIGAKAEESGRLSATLLIDHWKRHPETDLNKDGVMQYVILKGEPGHQDAELRTIYAMRAFAESGIKTAKLAEDSAFWDKKKGQEKMQEFLATFGDKIEAVLANNDDMALGAIDALKAVNQDRNKRLIPVVGVDATKQALEALEEGSLIGTVLNDAWNQGHAAFNLAIALSKKIPPSYEAIGYEISNQKYVWIDYRKITKENYKQSL